MAAIWRPQPVRVPWQPQPLRRPVPGTSGPSATVTEQNLPSNHLGDLTVHVVGSGTSFVNASTTFTASGVSGWSVVSTAVVDSTHATIVISGPTSASPPTGATGTLTLTEGVTGSVAATTTVGTPTLSIAPTFGAIGTTPSLTLTGTNTVWSSETASGLFSLAGGTGASIGTPTVGSNVGATATLTVGSATGTLTITDHSTGASVSFTATPAAVYDVRIGDSISANSLGYGSRTVPTIETGMLAKMGSLGTWTLNNQAAGGTHIEDFIPAYSIYPKGANRDAYIAVVTANPGCLLEVELGTNNMIEATPGSVYASHLNAIIGDALGAGAAKIIPHFVPYRTDADPAGDALLNAYNTAIDAAVNGTTVLQGDRLAYSWFKANPSELGDGVHPSNAGAESLATMQAWAVWHSLYGGSPPPPATGGVTRSRLVNAGG